MRNLLTGQVLQSSQYMREVGFELVCFYASLFDDVVEIVSVDGHDYIQIFAVVLTLIIIIYYFHDILMVDCSHDVQLSVLVAIVLVDALYCNFFTVFCLSQVNLAESALADELNDAIALGLCLDQKRREHLMMTASIALFGLQQFSVVASMCTFRLKRILSA